MLFHVQFCCFLTCIQISQKAGQVVWCSHLFKNSPQFVVIHAVKVFGIVNKAEVDVFLEPSYFFKKLYLCLNERISSMNQLLKRYWLVLGQISAQGAAPLKSPALAGVSLPLVPPGKPCHGTRAARSVALVEPPLSSLQSLGRV